MGRFVASVSIKLKKKNPVFLKINMCTIICSKLQSCREEFFKDIYDVVPSFINV